MAKSNSTLTAIFRVGHRFRCFMSFDLAASVSALQCRWYPKVPKRLTDREHADYRRGRNGLMAEVAKVLGGRVAVAEADSRI